MHTIQEVDGMRVHTVTQMQNTKDRKNRSRPGRKFDQPLQLVHAKDIATFYGMDIRDVWPLVFENAMGNRVPYNTGENRVNNRITRQWIETVDDLGRPHKEQELVEEEFIEDLGDGMFMELHDVLYFANSQGWEKGKGMPKNKEQAKANDQMGQLLELLSQLITRREVHPGELVTPEGPYMPQAAPERPKRTLTPEHQEKMRLAREGKKAAQSE